MSSGADLVLASASPRRRELLAKAGVRFCVSVSGLDEETVGKPAAPAEQARILAIEKASTVALRQPKRPVIGADTVIDYRGRLLGKPNDAAAARTMLGELAGKQHAVITGLCVLSVAGRILSATVTTAVRMRPVTRDEIDEYVATGESLDKAGSYAIQGRGAGLIEGIEGCYYNVVGLPLCELARLLATAGLESFSASNCRGPGGALCPRVGEEGTS